MQYNIKLKEVSMATKSFWVRLTELKFYHFFKRTQKMLLLEI